MNLPSHRSPPRGPGPAREAGVASVIVLVILFLLVALLGASSRIVSQLKQEIDLVERRQLNRHEAERVETNPLREPAIAPGSP